jgi:hypothetical protein
MEIKEENSTQVPKEISRRDFLKTAGSFAVSALIPTRFYDFAESLEKDNSFEESSRSYISDTPQEAEEISKMIRCDRGASASNVCGPLAVSALLGWRLNSDESVTNISNNTTSSTRIEGIIPNDMWLGSPENDPNRYRIAFPEDEYESFHIKESIGTIDFNNIDGIGSLKPGDFLYLDGGSFTHYISISKRDSEGRIYCVSNVHSTNPQEFDIKEVMLWDPAIKNGFFRNWANGVGPEGARTGLKGFYLWRRTKEADPILQDTKYREFRDMMTNELREYSSISCNMHVFEFGKGQVFEWRNKIPYRDPSALSLPISMIALKRINELYEDDIKEKGLEYVLENTDFEGVSLGIHLKNVLTTQYEDSRKALFRFTNMNDGVKSLNMKNTSPEYGTTTQKDIFKCWENLLCRKYLDIESVQYLLSMLEMGNRIWGTESTIGGIQKTRVIGLDGGKRYIYVGMNGSSKQTDKNMNSNVEEIFSKALNKLTSEGPSWTKILKKE